MAIKLYDSVNELLERVKIETGKEVKLSINKKMKTMIEAHIAKDNEKQHRILYSENYSQEINHLIASKALQMIRVYKSDYKNLKTAVAYNEHLNSARMSIAIETTRKPHLNVALNDYELTSTWILSLVNQLISQPASINIERYLYANYPDLRKLQYNIISYQFNDFNATLSKEVEELSPSIIYDTSAIMNYVYLKSMDTYCQTDFISKLNNVVKKSKSEKLYSYTKENLKDSIESDREIIDYWADFLGIKGWYTWADNA